MPWGKKNKEPEDNRPVRYESAMQKAAKEDFAFHIVHDLLGGLPKHVMVGKIMAQMGCTKEIAYELLDVACELIAEDVKHDMKYQVQLAQGRRLELYRRAMNADQLEVALKILKDMDTLRGLYNNQQVDRGRDALAELVSAMSQQATVNLEINNNFGS